MIVDAMREQAETTRSFETVARSVGRDDRDDARARVNFFMNKFRKLGFIDYGGDGVPVHPSLVTVVPHE